jgi:hypothetical protein
MLERICEIWLLRGSSISAFQHVACNACSNGGVTLIIRDDVALTNKDSIFWVIWNAFSALFLYSIVFAFLWPTYEALVLMKLTRHGPD